MSHSLLCLLNNARERCFLHFSPTEHGLQKVIKNVPELISHLPFNLDSLAPSAACSGKGSWGLELPPVSAGTPGHAPCIAACSASANTAQSCKTKYLQWHRGKTAAFGNAEQSQQRAAEGRDVVVGMAVLGGLGGCSRMESCLLGLLGLKDAGTTLQSSQTTHF